MWFPKQPLMSTSTKPESVCFDRWTTAWPCLTPPPPSLPLNHHQSTPPPSIHTVTVQLASCVLLTPAFLHSMCQVFCCRCVWGLQQCGIGLFISAFFFLCFLFFCFFARPDRSSPSAYSVFCKERLCEPKTITTRRCWDCFLRRGLCRQTHNKVSVAEQCFRNNFHQMIHTRGLLDLHDLKLRKENLW